MPYEWQSDGRGRAALMPFDPTAPPSEVPRSMHEQYSRIARGVIERFPGATSDEVRQLAMEKLCWEV